MTDLRIDSVSVFNCQTADDSFFICVGFWFVVCTLFTVYMLSEYSLLWPGSRTTFKQE